jgi:tRNA threonylcarbamoyladenosine biosynthesis protein TsaB
MSIILALDSSTDACSVALSVDGTLFSRFEIATKSHTQRLLPMVDELLAEQKLVLADLDALAFGRGPGSFTGLRICMGIVQGLSYGANLPVIPISTLEAMAMGFYRHNLQAAQTPVLVALDARMGEVYWALYQRDEDGVPQALTQEFVMHPQDLTNHLPFSSEASGAAIGAGWHYPAMPTTLTSSIDLTASPRADDMALLAARSYQLGQLKAINEVQPVYLRDTISWQKRQRIRTNPILNDDSQ